MRRPSPLGDRCSSHPSQGSLWLRSHHPLLVFAVVLLLVPLVPSVQAGSRAEPDVVDPVGDVVDELTNEAVSGAGVDPVDIRSAWFELNGDRLHIVLRVHDLRPHTDPAAFRTTDTIHQWLVRWDLDGYRLAALMSYDATGYTYGAVSVEGDVGSGGPSTDQTGANAAAIELDFALDEVRIDLPAEFTLDLLEAGISHTFSHSNGTFIANPWAQTFASRGAFGGCTFPCPRMDETQIGPSFTLGTAADNSFVLVRPLQPTAAVKPGGTATVPLRVSASDGQDLQAQLRTTVDQQGWTVMVPEQVTVGVDAPLDVELHVKAPPEASGVAVVTVHGGRAPAHVVVVVTELAGALDGLNGWAKTQTLAGPLLDALLERDSSVYHLAGTPQNGNGVVGDSAEHPVLAAFLTPSAPLAAGAEVSTTYAVDEDPTALGAYTGPRLSSLARIDGEASLDLHATWADLEGATVMALVGPAPLPVDGVAEDPPPGAFYLQSEPLEADGDGIIRLTGHSNGTRLAAGDRLAVSLFVRGESPSGTLTTHVFSKDKDSHLRLGIDHALAPRLELLAPGTRSLALTGVGALSHAAQAAYVPVAIVDGQAVQPTRRDAVPIGVRLGAGDVETVATHEGSLQATSGADEASHRFEVSDGHHAVTLELAAGHAMSHYNDNQVWIDLYRVDGDTRMLVKSARAPGPEQTLRLLPHDLAAAGRGTYEAVVRYYLAGSGLGGDTDYTLTVTLHSDAYVADAGTLVVHSFDVEDLPLGPIRFELRDAPGATVDALRVHHTAVGFTQSPTVAIDGPLRLQAGAAFTLSAAAVDLDGRIVAHRWDMGDGTTYEGQSVEHGYERPGTYQVVLEVEDDVGAIATAKHLVQVSAQAVDDGSRTATGTIGSYTDAYEAGLAHLEEYTADWLAREVAGHLGGDYLDTGPTQAYVQGTWPTAGREVTILDGGVLRVDGLPTGATVELRHDQVTVGLGDAGIHSALPREMHVNGAPTALPGFASAPDPSADDALAQVVATATSDAGLTMRAEATQMTGTLHADQRLRVSAGVTQELEATTQVQLPLDPAGWLAYPLPNGTVQVLPANDVQRFGFGGDADEGDDELPGWFATFDPDGAHAYGIVLAGDLRSLSATPRPLDDELVLALHWAGTGELGLAHYPIAYGVQDPLATRYAGVAELHRLERHELGIALLDADQSAVRAWHSSDARIELVEMQRADSLLDKLWEPSTSWRLELEAPAEQGGKALRVIMDAAPVLDGAMRLKMDGQAMDPSLVRSVSDERTLLVTVTIPTFSLHEVFIETVAPGVPPLFLWLTLLLAIVVLIETLVIGRMAKRRRDERVRRGGSSPAPVARRRRSPASSSTYDRPSGNSASAAARAPSVRADASATDTRRPQRLHDQRGLNTATDAAKVSESRDKQRPSEGVDIVSILGMVLLGGRP